MATAAEIYKALAAGKRLTLLTESKQRHETLRVALCKQHQTPKALELVDGSICADYDAASGQSTFWLGERRIKGSRVEFTIVSEVDPNEEV